MNYYIRLITQGRIKEVEKFLNGLQGLLTSWLAICLMTKFLLLSSVHLNLTFSLACFWGPWRVAVDTVIPRLTERPSQLQWTSLLVHFYSLVQCVSLLTWESTATLLPFLPPKIQRPWLFFLVLFKAKWKNKAEGNIGWCHVQMSRWSRAGLQAILRVKSNLSCCQGDGIALS